MSFSHNDNLMIGLSMQENRMPAIAEPDYFNRLADDLSYGCAGHPLRHPSPVFGGQGIAWQSHVDLGSEERDDDGVG